MGALYVTATCGFDPANTVPESVFPALPGPVTSNKVSIFGIHFEAPTDNDGNPILTVNNPNSPMPGASASDAADPLPPRRMTKVDLVYPSGQAGVVTLSQSEAGLRLWDSPSGGNLVAFPGQGLAIDMATSSLTAAYAEAVPEDGNGSWYQALTVIYSGPYAAYFDGQESRLALVGVSLSLAGAQPGDPDATIPIDPPSSSGGSGADPQFAKLDLNLPGLANGTTVTLSIDPAIASLINVYSDNGAAPPTTMLFGADAGTTNYSWTVGNNNPPWVVDVESLGEFTANANAFTMTVQVPAGAGSAGVTGETGAAGEPGECTATQPAVAPTKGLLVAFDGSQDDGYSGFTNIYKFMVAYDGVIPPIYERGTATPQYKTTTAVGAAIKKVFTLEDLALNGVPEMIQRVDDAIRQIQAFYKVPAHATVPLDVIGYSRGAIEADILLHYLLQTDDVSVENAEGTQMSFRNARIPVRFVGLVAPVASFKGDALAYINLRQIAPQKLPDGPTAPFEEDALEWSWLDIFLTQWHLAAGEAFLLNHIQIAQTTPSTTPLEHLEAQAAKAHVAFYPT